MPDPPARAALPFLPAAPLLAGGGAEVPAVNTEGTEPAAALEGTPEPDRVVVVVRGEGPPDA